MLFHLHPIHSLDLKRLRKPQDWWGTPSSGLLNGGTPKYTAWILTIPLRQSLFITCDWIVWWHRTLFSSLEVSNSWWGLVCQSSHNLNYFHKKESEFLFVTFRRSNVTTTFFFLLVPNIFLTIWYTVPSTRCKCVQSSKYRLYYVYNVCNIAHLLNE